VVWQYCSALAPVGAQQWGPARRQPCCPTPTQRRAPWTLLASTRLHTHAVCSSDRCRPRSAVQADVFSLGVMMYEILHKYIMLSAVAIKGTFEELQARASC